MPTTYEPIATTTLGSAQSSVTFSSISGSFTDLVIAGAVGSTSTTLDRNMRIQFNSDTNSNYSDTDVYGEGSTAGSFRRSNQNQMIINEAIARSGNFSTYIINVMNYSNSTTNKTVLGRGGNTNLVAASVGLWRNTAAITSITLLISGDNFASGSTFTLYGIKAA